MSGRGRCTSPSDLTSTRSLSSPKSVLRSQVAPSRVVDHAPWCAGRRACRRWRPDSTSDRSQNHMSKCTPMRCEACRGGRRMRPGVAPLERVGVGRASRPPSRRCTRPGSRPRESLAGTRAASDAANVLHLGAAVVEVVLAVHVVARCARARAKRVAVGRPPAVAGVERAGGVGGDELDVDRRDPRRGRGGRSRRPRLDDVAEHVVQPGRPQAEVHEAGPGDLDGRRRGAAASASGARPAAPPAREGCGRRPSPRRGRRSTTSRRARRLAGRSRPIVSGTGDTSSATSASRRDSTSVSRITGLLLVQVGGVPVGGLDRPIIAGHPIRPRLGSPRHPKRTSPSLAP